MRIVKMSESALQKAVKTFAAIHKLPMHHSPNEAKRSLVLGKKLKDEGMMPGFSDCFFIRGNDEFKGIFLELKIKPNKLTQSQTDFLELVKQEGYMGSVCYTLDEAIALISAFYSLK